MTKRQIISIFIPAFFIVVIGLAVRIIQYDPLYPKETPNNETAETIIPIFPDDPILGNKKAPITLIAFEDLGCENCAYQSGLLDELLAQYPNKLKIIWKSLPVTQFPISSVRAHAYAACANKQGKFNEFKLLAFANQENLKEDTLKLIAGSAELNEKKLNTCLESGMPQQIADQNETIATVLQIQAVPTFFLNNKQIQLPQNIDEWKTLLQL